MTTTLITKGTLLKVKHSRKGTFIGRALKDFSPDIDEWYPIAVAQDETIQGLNINNTWSDGEEIPCRNILCKVSVLS